MILIHINQINQYIWFRDRATFNVAHESKILPTTGSEQQQRTYLKKSERLGEYATKYLVS